jgi:hypothetical protein
MQAKQVKDIARNAVASGTLGTFTANVSSVLAAAPSLKAARPVSGPPSREQAALLAAAADAAFSSAERERKTAVLETVFASVDDWLW